MPKTWETPEKLNLRILEFLNVQKIVGVFWSKTEMAHELKVAKPDRVGKVLRYYHRKKFVEKFLDIDKLEQKRIEKKSPKQIQQTSYRLTKKGKEKYEEILKSCLDDIGQKLLHFEKINSLD